MSRLRALGCDISRWQGKTDFKKMKNAGASFVYIKASQNIIESDLFRDQWKAAKEAGLLRGAYHFYDMRTGSNSPKDQAEFFSEILSNDVGELRPVIDFENPGISGYPDYPGHSECERIVRQFSERVDGNLGVWPMLYTNLAGIQKLEPLTAQLAAMDLWIAWYSVEAHQPKYGVWPNWRFWQYKSAGDGIGFGVESKSIDMNAFNGTVNDLYDYANSLGLSKQTLHL